MAVPATAVRSLASSGQTLVRGFPHRFRCPPGAEGRLVVGSNCLGTLGGADQGKSAHLAHSLGRSCRAQHPHLGETLNAGRRTFSRSFWPAFRLLLATTCVFAKIITKYILIISASSMFHN